MQRAKSIVREKIERGHNQAIYREFQNYTMIPESYYIANLKIADGFKAIQGCVVECGVWRGGMIAGVSKILGAEREYFLFDSFEGLPVAQKIDGEAAIAWQNNKVGEYYFDNCKAEPEYADEVMKACRVKKYELVKGWFVDTIPGYKLQEKIALLRLDADWYESTMICLDNLFCQVAPGGVVILDDYYTWDGCSRAVHDFLSKNSFAERIKSFAGVCYIEKQ